MQGALVAVLESVEVTLVVADMLIEVVADVVRLVVAVVVGVVNAQFR